MPERPTVCITTELSGAPFDWALSQLRDALATRYRVGEEEGVFIHVANPDEPANMMLPPDKPDSFLVEPGGGVVALGASTPRGLVYAMLFLAERVRLAAPGENPLFFPAPLVQQPAGAVRSVARFFNSVDEDLAWLHDENGWCDYLDMLAANRFSGFSLNFGLQYNYPYYNRLITDCYLYFAYPFLVDVPGHAVRVTGLSDAERARNLRALRFVAAEAARRGLDFRIGLWTHGYDFDDVPDANHQITGLSADNHAAYCRDALHTLVSTVPGLTGVTIRVHVEAGVPEGAYGFWETVFDGLKGAEAAPGRPLALDIHAKGTDARMIGIALGTGLPVTVSPKFMAEHTGLPYHQAAVREREMPSPQQGEGDREGTMFRLSEGSRKFLRYGYGDLLDTARQFDVVVRVWPGTQRVLLSADPALAAAYGRAGVFCGANGIEFFEPLSFKGRMGSGRPGGRFGYSDDTLRERYDWAKYVPQFILWGRLAYDPDAPADTWLRPLRALAGDAAEACLRALAPASRVLPLFTHAHGVSACNNTYWPEVYDNMSLVYAPPEYPYGYDSGGATRFGDVTSFDPQLFASPAEFVRALHDGEVLVKYGPLDVAGWLEGMAQDSDAAAQDVAAQGAADTRPVVRRMLVDAALQAGLGRFFAARLRSACAFELYLLTGLQDAYKDAMAFYRRARDAWAGVVATAEHTYLHDLSYGVQPWLRGSWRDRLPAIDRDIEDLDYWYINDRDRHPADRNAARAALDRLRAWQGPVATPLDGQFPATFVPGKEVVVSVRLAAATTAGTERLHFRRVNQSERWQSVAMEAGADGSLTGRIPATATATSFPLQFYVTARNGGRPLLAPGLSADLCSVPYKVAMPR